jgi:alpha-mannosidase
MKKYILFILFLLTFTPALYAQKEVVSWLLLGPFNCNGQRELLEEKYIDETSERPRGGKISGGKIWRLIKENEVDFYDPLISSDNLENNVYYAAFYVNYKGTKTGQKVLKISYSEGITIYVNGSEEYSINTPGGLDVNDELIDINIKPGWNTVIIRLFNTKGKFYLKASFADEYGLAIQTDNPFLQNKNEFIPLRINPIENDKLNSITLTESGRFLMNFNRSYTNYSTAESEKLRYQLVADNEKILSKNYGRLNGGEIFGFGFNVSVDDLIKKQKPKFEIKLFSKDKEIYTDTLIQKNLFPNFVSALFAPIPIKGWERDFKKGKVVFSREFFIPPAFDNLGIDLFIDIGSNLSTIKINDVVVKEKFWEESGDVAVTKNAKSGNKIKIEIVADPNDKNGQPISLRYSCLYLRNQSIERILGNLLYSKKITKKWPLNPQEVYGNIYEYLTKKDSTKLSTLLTLVEDSTKMLLPDIKKYHISHIGNAHIDMAWLWQYPETIEVTRQTFKAALENMHKMPFFKFTHGQAQSYEWIEKYYPDIFTEIKNFVKEGRWEPIGGSWVENDLNMSSGEFTLRQYLYGKRFFFEKFGTDVNIGYSPDTFGHPESLPSILRTCGIDKYIFFRPYEEEKLFNWKSKEGSVVLAHRPAGWFTSYDSWNRSNIVPDKNYYNTIFETDSTFNLKNNLHFYGVGDHGGGPTLKEIEHITFLDSLKAYPSNSFNTVEEYYKSLNISELKIDTFRGEMNPVFEGCYTSQAKMKRLNRQAEYLLPMTEMFSVISEKFGNPYSYDELNTSWKKVLFNQFHDILPGSAVSAVYNDASRDYDTVFTTCIRILKNSFRSLAMNINTKTMVHDLIPVVVFNNLNWKRNAPVEMVIKKEPGINSVKVYDDKNKEISSQIIENGSNEIHFIFIASDVPSIGYRTYWLKLFKNEKTDIIQQNPKNNNSWQLENMFYKVSIDQYSGSVYSIYDKKLKTELLAESSLGNEFQLQNDGGNAWEIKLSSEPEPIISPKSIKIIEDSKVRKIIRVEYQFSESTFFQDIILYYELPIIYFKYKIDWHERGKILKIKFPTSLTDVHSESEIPFSSIIRKSDGCEMVHQKYFNILNDEMGITFLNDSKYGCSISDSVVYLTALRSPSDPDPNADMGLHEFSYGISSNNIKNTKKISARLGYEFNSPMPYFITTQHNGKLSSKHSFIDTKNDNIIITALKKSEDKKSNIIRFYEVLGIPANIRINNYESFKSINEIDAVEMNDGKSLGSGNTINCKIKPFEIKSIILNDKK